MAFINLQYDQEHAKNAALGGGNVLDEGWYIWQVQSFEHLPPKETGKYSQTVCKCEIRQSFNQKALGRTITVRFQHHPNSVPYRLTPFLKAAGIPFQDNGAGSIGFDDSLLNGAIVKAVCKHKAGDTATFEEWGAFEPAAGGPTVQPATQAAFAPPMQMQPMQQPQQFVQQPQQAWQQPMQQNYGPPQSTPQQMPGQMQPPMTWGAQQPAQQPYPQNGHGQQPIQQPGAPQGWPPGAYPQQGGR